MITICVAAQKGGVGKTTTTHCLAAGLKAKGNKVLCIDLDPQCNLSFAVGVQAARPSAYDALTTGENAIQSANGLDIVPAVPQLSAVDIQLMSTTGKEYRLREFIAKYASGYDYVIIDTPPALGLLTVNALTAADYAVIPAQADVFSLQGIGQLAQTVDAVKHYCNERLTIAGILLTRYNGRAILSKDVKTMAEDTATQMSTFVYKTTIRECIALKEAQANQEDIFAYAPRSKGAQDYTDFIKELEAFINGR